MENEVPDLGLPPVKEVKEIEQELDEAFASIEFEECLENTDKVYDKIAEIAMMTEEEAEKVIFAFNENANSEEANSVDNIAFEASIKIQNQTAIGQALHSTFGDVGEKTVDELVKILAPTEEEKNSPTNLLQQMAEDEKRQKILDEAKELAVTDYYELMLKPHSVMTLEEKKEALHYLIKDVTVYLNRLLVLTEVVYRDADRELPIEEKKYNKLNKACNEIFDAFNVTEKDFKFLQLSEKQKLKYNKDFEIQRLKNKIEQLEHPERIEQRKQQKNILNEMTDRDDESNFSDSVEVCVDRLRKQHPEVQFSRNDEE